MRKVDLNERICNGRLTQVGQSFRNESRRRVAVFCCSCGKRPVLRVDHVKSGHTGGCGACSADELRIHAANHGHTCGGEQSPSHRTWCSMHARCKAKPGSHHWPYYGAKSITVCDRWKSFELFLSDMGPRPKGHTIDRKDGTKGYSPENCRWATKAVQCLNVSDIRMVEHDGVTLCLKDWARKIGMGYLTLWTRINAGWSIEKALTTPVRKRKVTV